MLDPLCRITDPIGTERAEMRSNVGNCSLDGG